MRNPSFGKLVKKLVDEHGSRRRLAIALDVTEKTVHRWESTGLGENTVRNFKAVLRLADMAKCPLSEVLR